MNTSNRLRYTKSENHEYCVDIETFNIDNVSFYVGNKFSYSNVYVRYKYDDGKIRNLQLKTDFSPVIQNTYAVDSKCSVCVFTKDALYLTTILNAIQMKFVDYCSAEEIKESNGIDNVNVFGFVKSSGDYQRFVIKLNDKTRLVNYNISKKYEPVEEIKNISDEIIKRLLPKQKFNASKKEGSFILKPYFCCVKVTNKIRNCYGMLGAHTAEIKYNGAYIKSVVEHKICKPYKIPKNAHLNITI